MTTLKEMFIFFRKAYTNELSERLTEDDIEDGGFIDGSLLNSVDQNAYNATVAHFGHRVPNIYEAFQDAGEDVYEGIDYQEIIQKTRVSEAQA